MSEVSENCLKQLVISFNSPFHCSDPVFYGILDRFPVLIQK